MKIYIPAREVEVEKHVLITGDNLKSLILELFDWNFICGTALWQEWSDYVHHSLGGSNSGDISDMVLIEHDTYSNRYSFSLTWTKSGGTAIVIFGKYA